MYRLHVPIHTEGMLLEPMFSFLKVGQNSSAKTLLRLGLTAAATRKPDAQTLVYGGAHLELFSAASSGYNASNIFSFGAVAGAEYYLSPHFSFGGEGQLNILPGEELGTMIGQTVRVFLRFYH